MNDWLDELRLALDAAPARVPFFFRDDDAGWDDDRLFKLLDLFARHSLPVDVAAIPAAMTDRLAVELCRRMETGPGWLGVHQHGFAHRNHEATGRKCEFGVSRTLPHQQRDIEAGKERLVELFGQRLSPIFTPPWNRCTTETGECLRRTGFLILSRDSTATPLNLDGLSELPVTIDWFARDRGVRLTPDRLGARLAEAAGTTAPVGIMFHHAIMDDCERRKAGELLALIARHENAESYLMEQLASAFIKRNESAGCMLAAPRDLRATPAERNLS